MRFLGKKLRKVKGSQEKHEAEVSNIETNINKALKELRIDLVWFLPDEISDVLIQDLMGKLDKLSVLSQ